MSRPSRSRFPLHTLAHTTTLPLPLPRLHTKTLQGAGDFVGTQLHAKDFTDYSVTRGRRVLIVGAGKTALDCMSGLVSANTAASVTMLYRKSHWPVPRSLLGVSIRRLMFNRTMANMLPPYYTAGKLERASAVVTKPLRRLFWKGLEVR